MEEYTIVNAHYLNQCHPETCGCPEDYIVCKNIRDGSHFEYERIHYVHSEKKGKEVIKLLKKYPKMFEDTDFESGLIMIVKELEKK